MKLLSCTIIALGLFAFTLSSCKKDVPVQTPVEELILGTWQSVLKKENGQTQPADLGYSELEFSIDTLSEQNVSIREFEQDGSPTTSTLDTWELAENNTIINFGDINYGISLISQDSLILIYAKNDPFSGNEVDHEDRYLKIE